MDCKRTPGCAFRRDGTCRLLMGTCYGVVTKRMCKYAEPCKWVSESESCIPKADDNSHNICRGIDSAQACRHTAGCQFGESGPCRPFDGICGNLVTRKECNAGFGCDWKKSAC